MEGQPTFPMRVNRYLALQKYATRRGADELIKKRQVFINGRLAVLGDKVNESDNVEVRRKGEAPSLVYMAYHKPGGVATQDAGRIRSQAHYAPAFKNLFPIGGIDKDAHGLVILTNDGRITEKLLSPESNVQREYLVTVKGALRSSFKERMEAGVMLEDGPAKKCKVKVLDKDTFRVTLTEERKHQIKRMCVALFEEVRDITRLRIMNISLGTLKEGSYRKIEGEELETFLAELDLS